ncbi:MAG: Ig-like domain-containing protein [Pseudoflavonifractor sp.]|nr:Ig-like domain-containing protein [Pseudoflavonifractor sp.]
MKTGRNRFFGSLMCVALAFMLLPGIFPKAYAASTDVKTIQMDSYNDQFNIRGGGANWLYFGHYNGSPIAWRVLSTTLNGTCSYSGKGLFLMSEPMLGNMIYCNAASVCPYSDSYVHAACASLYNGGNSCFTAQERGAVLSTTKGTDASVSLNNASPLQGCGLNGEYLYALSAAEATNADYGFAVDGDTSDPSRENVSSWWLRSPTTYDAGFVDRPGELNYCVPDYYLHTYGVRPACNLALSEALFASPAVGGKVSGTVGAGALTAVGSRTVNEWKLTLLDSHNRILTLYDGSVVGGPGYTRTISYQAYCEENPGKNEYISAIITDSEGNPLYYGRLAQITTDQYDQIGDVSLTIPAGLAAGKYTIKYFMEQYNGDYETDYASDFADVPLTVLPTVTNVTVPASRTYKTEDDLDFTVSFNSSVTVEGTPYIPVTVGNKQAYAYYVSGSGSDKLVFRYTAAAGDNDSDGIVLGDAIVLNGGTIKGGTTDAQLTLNNAAATAGIKVDTTAPTVAAVTPGNLATNIFTSGNMEITFSESMSTAAGTITLSGAGGSPKNLGGGSWLSSNTYRIPYSGLDCSTEYTVTISGFKDAVGNGMEYGYNGSFTTEARPAVQSVVPAGGAAGVPVGGSLTVTFSRAMAAGHGTVSLNGEPLAGGSWTNDTTYSIPYSGLDCSALYTIGISGFQDTRGSAILDNTDCSFTTEARPAVQSVAPVNGATGVLVGGSLTVTFSRAMAAGHGTISLNGEPLAGGSWTNETTYSIP